MAFYECIELGFSTSNCLNFPYKYTISLLSISRGSLFPCFLGLDSFLKYPSAKSPWHPVQAVTAAFRGLLIELFVGEKNQICALNEQLFSGVKRSKVKVKALKAEATTVFVFLIIVAWLGFLLVFFCSQVWKGYYIRHIIAILFISTLIHVATLPFMWPLRGCTNPVCHFLVLSLAALHVAGHRLPILLIQLSFCSEGHSYLQSMSMWYWWLLL